MIYDVDYFINKFEAIPENKWTTGFFKNNGKCCANGHCGIDESTEVQEGEEAHALAMLLMPLRKDYWQKFLGDPVYEVTAVINDGGIDEYPQTTPKQRILAALYDIKAMTKDIDTGKKERIVYVAVPASITEQSKDLVLS